MSFSKTLLLTGGSGMVGSNIKEQLIGTDIIHAAGIVGGIQANINNPVAFLDKNISIGRNIIMAAFEAGIERFINLASTCVYPRGAQNPLTEEMILTGELEPTNGTV